MFLVLITHLESSILMYRHFNVQDSTDCYTVMLSLINECSEQKLSYQSLSIRDSHAFSSAGSPGSVLSVDYA